MDHKTLESVLDPDTITLIKRWKCSVTGQALDDGKITYRITIFRERVRGHGRIVTGTMTFNKDGWMINSVGGSCYEPTEEFIRREIIFTLEYGRHEKKLPFRRVMYFNAYA